MWGRSAKLSGCYARFGGKSTPTYILALSESSQNQFQENGGSQGKSVNDGISKDLCLLSIDEATARVVSNGRGAFMAKFDLKSGSSTPRGSLALGR